MEEEKKEDKAEEQKDVTVYNLQPANCTHEADFVFRFITEEDT